MLLVSYSGGPGEVLCKTHAQLLLTRPLAEYSF